MAKHFVVLLIYIGIVSGAILAVQPAAAAATVGQESGHTLILDAGHGGEDGGALSADGEKESDINLAIVLRLEQLMGFCGVCPVLTRREDRSLHDVTADTLREKKVSDLHNRVALVEGAENPVFLSVHQNSYADAKYSGAQVFYAPTEGSASWGEAAQALLRGALDENNTRGAKEIPDTVYLMNHIRCPGLLVECGFLSNREEAHLLGTAEYQKKVAAALAGVCLCCLRGI